MAEYDTKPSSSLVPIETETLIASLRKKALELRNLIHARSVVVGEPEKCGYCGALARAFYSLNPTCCPDMSASRVRNLRH